MFSMPFLEKSLPPIRCQALPPPTKEIYNENRFERKIDEMMKKNESNKIKMVTRHNKDTS